MTYSESILEAAREIIRSCEEYQLGNDSAYSKEQEQLLAYRRLRELLLPEARKIDL